MVYPIEFPFCRWFIGIPLVRFVRISHPYTVIRCLLKSHDIRHVHIQDPMIAISMSIGWFKGNIRGKSHFSWENLWFPVKIFPFLSTHWPRGFKIRVGFQRDSVTTCPSQLPPQYSSATCWRPQRGFAAGKECETSTEWRRRQRASCGMSFLLGSTLW